MYRTVLYSTLLGICHPSDSTIYENAENFYWIFKFFNSDDRKFHSLEGLCILTSLAIICPTCNGVSLTCRRGGATPWSTPPGTSTRFPSHRSRSCERNAVAAALIITTVFIVPVTVPISLSECICNWKNTRSVFVLFFFARCSGSWHYWNLSIILLHIRSFWF